MTDYSFNFFANPGEPDHGRRSARLRQRLHRGRPGTGHDLHVVAPAHGRGGIMTDYTYTPATEPINEIPATVQASSYEKTLTTTRKAPRSGDRQWSHRLLGVGVDA